MEKQNDVASLNRRQLLKDSLGWGFVLWLIGYILGIILFPIVSNAFIGWVIMPVGTLITLWVLFKKIKGNSAGYYYILALVWTLVAIAGDYFFLVKLFKPADGYYKPDVYLYYALTFILPLIAGFRRNRGIK